VFMVLFCQVALLVFHQVTTLVDFFPFNGSHNYTRTEKFAEAGVNGVLMLLPPIGFAFHIRGLMIFGEIYYFVLFAIELLIWWVPYLTTPSGRWRDVYNRLLAGATLDFEKGDELARWQATCNRLHRGTITILPGAWRQTGPESRAHHSARLDADHGDRDGGGILLPKVESLRGQKTEDLLQGHTRFVGPILQTDLSLCSARCLLFADFHFRASQIPGVVLNHLTGNSNSGYEQQSVPGR